METTIVYWGYIGDRLFMRGSLEFKSVEGCVCKAKFESIVLRRRC